MRGEEDQKPVIVLRDGEELLLREAEMKVLSLGPKFCILNKICEESFEREVAECIVKYRWELRSEKVRNEEINKFGRDTYGSSGPGREKSWTNVTFFFK